MYDRSRTIKTNCNVSTLSLRVPIAQQSSLEENLRALQVVDGVQAFGRLDLAVLNYLWPSKRNSDENQPYDAHNHSFYGYNVNQTMQFHKMVTQHIMKLKCAQEIHSKLILVYSNACEEM